MSVLYCTIPDFAAALVRRDNPGLQHVPLVLIGPGGQVFGVSAEAATAGVAAGMAAQAAEIRCPEAYLLEADIASFRAEREALLQLLEQVSARVEPHCWEAAYVDLRGLVRDQRDAVTLCQEIGRTVRKNLGEALQPALGWDSSKFTAQTAGRRTSPGHLLAIAAVREQGFLQPLPVTLLPLPKDVLLRLCFLGLRTLGQYAALPMAAVWQQFGQAGKLAHRCAQGKDDRPVVPRWQAPQLQSECEFETPLVERDRLLAELGRMVGPMMAKLRGRLQACGQVRLTVQFDDGSMQERERTFLYPAAAEGTILRALGQLLDGLRWPSAATALVVVLGQIQDAVTEQLTLFPLEGKGQGKIQEVQRYLATRFGANRLRRAILAQPGAPLPEWRAGWLAEDEA